MIVSDSPTGSRARVFRGTMPLIRGLLTSTEALPLQIWHAVVLGLVEGITEYLPISSTGHLIIAKALMGLTDEKTSRSVDDFLIVIQGGAILAVLGLYWPRVMQMLRGLLGKDPAGFKLACNLVLGFIPAGVFGLLLDKWIESRLFYLGPVLAAVLVGGVFMMWIDQWRGGRFGLVKYHSCLRSIEDLSPLDALLIGFMQCIAMWPGTSRSMMTMTGGFLVGLRPRAAAEFAFLLGLPTLGGATVLKLVKNLWHAHKTGEPNLFQDLGIMPAVVGILVAAIAAAVAVKWLVGFLNRHGLTPFGWYRIALFVVLLILASRNVIQIAPPGSGPKIQGTTVVPPIGEIR